MQALGLPASGKVQIEPGDLEGRTALVEVRPAEYQGQDGTMVRRNEVPYDGYRATPPESEAAGVGRGPAQGTRPRLASAERIEERDIPF